MSDFGYGYKDESEVRKYHIQDCFVKIRVCQRISVGWEYDSVDTAIWVCTESWDTDTDPESDGIAEEVYKHLNDTVVGIILGCDELSKEDVLQYQIFEYYEN